MNLYNTYQTSRNNNPISRAVCLILIPKNGRKKIPKIFRNFPVFLPKKKKRDHSVLAKINFYVPNRN